MLRGGNQVIPRGSQQAKMEPSHALETIRIHGGSILAKADRVHSFREFTLQAVAIGRTAMGHPGFLVETLGLDSETRRVTILLGSTRGARAAATEAPGGKLTVGFGGRVVTRRQLAAAPLRTIMVRGKPLTSATAGHRTSIGTDGAPRGRGREMTGTDGMLLGQGRETTGVDGKFLGSNLGVSGEVMETSRMARTWMLRSSMVPI